MEKPQRQYLTADQVVVYAHALGASHVNKGRVITAAYRHPIRLRKFKVDGRVYYRIKDVDAWLTGVPANTLEFEPNGAA